MVSFGYFNEKVWPWIKRNSKRRITLAVKFSVTLLNKKGLVLILLENSLVCTSYISTSRVTFSSLCHLLKVMQMCILWKVQHFGTIRVLTTCHASRYKTIRVKRGDNRSHLPKLLPSTCNKNKQNKWSSASWRVAKNFAHLDFRRYFNHKKNCFCLWLYVGVQKKSLKNFLLTIYGTLEEMRETRKTRFLFLAFL